MAAIACFATTSLAAPLGAAQNILPLDAVDLVDIPRLDFQAIDAEDHTRAAAGEAYRYAIPHGISLTPATDGTWERIDADSLMWRIRIASQDATSINLAFGEFMLPERAQLVLYTADGLSDIRPFTAADNNPDNELWTPPLPGEDIVVELQIDERDRDFIERNRRPDQRRLPQVLRPANTPSRSGSCNYDVECSGPTTGEMRFRASPPSRPGLALLHRLHGEQPRQRRHPVLHDGRSLRHQQRQCCITGRSGTTRMHPHRSAAPATQRNRSLDQFTTGSTLRANACSSDFTLVEFYTAPDDAYGVGYCGWDANDVITEYSVAIHHPNVDNKRWSIDYDNSEIYGYNTPGTTHCESSADLGTTEPIVGSPSSTRPCRPLLVVRRLWQRPRGLVRTLRRPTPPD